MKHFIISLLLLTPNALLGQTWLTAPTEATDSIDYWAIEFMSTSEPLAIALSEDPEQVSVETPQARSLRVVVYRSEIYQSLVIETLTTGLEGCCGQITRRQSVDLEAFASYFGLHGEVSGFVFSNWVSPQSFAFTYYGVPFSATVMNDDQIQIERHSSADY